jgi:hypothetical protein
MTNSILQQVREWADKNAAGWVVELLRDERQAAVRGPLVSGRVCDFAAERYALMLGLL